ncbi:unnamed protein product, partial [Vitis vinifera]
MFYTPGSRNPAPPPHLDGRNITVNEAQSSGSGSGCGGYGGGSRDRGYEDGGSRYSRRGGSSGGN